MLPLHLCSKYPTLVDDDLLVQEGCWLPVKKCFLLPVSIIDTWLGTHFYLTVDTKQSLGVSSSGRLFSFEGKKQLGHPCDLFIYEKRCLIFEL